MKLIDDIFADAVDGEGYAKTWQRVVPETNIEREILSRVIQKTIDSWSLYLMFNEDKNCEASIMLRGSTSDEYGEEGIYHAWLSVSDPERSKTFPFAMEKQTRMTFRILADPYDGEYTSDPLHIWWTLEQGIYNDRAQENWDFAPVLAVYPQQSEKSTSGEQDER